MYLKSIFNKIFRKKTLILWQNKEKRMVSKQFKAGLIAVISIVSFIFLVNFLKGKNVFSSGKTIYAIYDNVNGLMPTKPVTINGMKVGTVEKIGFTDDKSGKILVAMNIDTEFDFDKNTRAVIYEPGIMSGAEVKLEMSRKGAAIKDGDHVQGVVESSMMAGLSKEMAPLRVKLEKTLISLDSTLIGVRGFTTPENQRVITELLQNLNGTISSYKHLSNSVDNTVLGFNTTSGSFNKLALDAQGLVADNRNSFTNAMNSLNGASLSFKNVSSQLEKAEIDKTIAKLDATLGSMQAMMASIEKGDGSLGKLVKDEKLYNNLKGASKELEQLLRDVKENPKRYVHFSVFGKKGAQYVAPVEIDSIK